MSKYTLGFVVVFVFLFINKGQSNCEDGDNGFACFALVYSNKLLTQQSLQQFFWSSNRAGFFFSSTKIRILFALVIKSRPTRSV